MKITQCRLVSPEACYQHSCPGEPRHSVPSNESLLWYQLGLEGHNSAQTVEEGERMVLLHIAEFAFEFK